MVLNKWLQLLLNNSLSLYIKNNNKMPRFKNHSVKFPGLRLKDLVKSPNPRKPHNNNNINSKIFSKLKC